VVFGLIFLKYISDAFEAKHAELEAQNAQGAEPEDPDEYRAASGVRAPFARTRLSFRVPPPACHSERREESRSELSDGNLALSLRFRLSFRAPAQDS
jgi:type I restriction-modification system DNA methylase subunit